MKKTITKKEGVLALYELKNLLGNPETVIGGTLALNLHGFDIEIHDVDAVVYVSQEDSKILREKLTLLTKANVPENGTECSGIIEGKDGTRYSFIFKDIKFDVWFRLKDRYNVLAQNSGPDPENLYCDNMRVNDITTIINYKKKYNRAKDIEALNKLASQILKM